MTSSSDVRLSARPEVRPARPARLRCCRGSDARPGSCIAARGPGCRTRRNGPWSSRATWGGRPPRRNDVAVVAHDVRLNRRARVAGVVVAPRGRLILDPARSVTLTSRGNIVVRGRLVAAPKSASIRHRIHFAGIKEGRFKGGGMSVKRSDVGLWVVDRGVLRIGGAPKVPWLLASASIEAGSTTVELAGIRHGSYVNGYEYKDSLLFGNLFAAIDLTALSSEKRQLNFLRVWCDCAGLSDHAVVTGNHVLNGMPARFEHGTFRNYRHSAFGFTPKKSKRADEIDVIDCSCDGNEFWMYDTAHPGSLIRFESGGDELALRHLSSAEPGIVRPEWNAKVTTT